MQGLTRTRTRTLTLNPGPNPGPSLSSAGQGVESLAQGNAEVDQLGDAIETLDVQLEQLPVDAHKLV